MGFSHHFNSLHIWYISYIINTHFFHGNIWTHNWPSPKVSGFIAQLVEHRIGIARSRAQTPLKSWIFFSGFFTQFHKLRSLRRSFLHFHFISVVHIWFNSYNINISYIINSFQCIVSALCFFQFVSIDWEWQTGLSFEIIRSLLRLRTRVLIYNLTWVDWITRGVPGA